MSFSSLITVACSAALASALLAPRAVAQLELPQQPISHPPVEASPTGAIDLPEAPRGKLLGRLAGRDPYTEPGIGQDPLPPSGGLDLPNAPLRPIEAHPSAPPLPAPAGETSPNAAAAPRPLEAAPLGNLPAAHKDAAAFILSEVRRVTDPENKLVDQAAQSLIGLDEIGRDAARASLSDDHPAVLLACAKVLLSSPDAADRALVLRRLKGKLPTGACGVLVDAFVRLDPVSASPRALCDLLEHSQQGVRAAAQRQLEAHRDGALLPLLRNPLTSERTDTRMRALELAQHVDDPAVTVILLECLKDRSAQVADRAALALAASNDDHIERELRNRAFDQQWILRDSAYAILTLVEREDMRMTACFDERHVEPLLRGLASSDPFVGGACAAALAGLGFRTPALAEERWLDLDVPHRLVRAVAGVEFHNDFSSLQKPAVRRLALISGQSMGPDGPAWLAWWTKAAPTFKARRAVIAAKPEDAPSVGLYFATNTSDPDAFRLLGPTAPMVESPGPIPCEILRVSDRQARDLFDVLTREGVFGAERLPGTRGGATTAGRTLEVGIAGRTKSFRFAGTSSEPWFDKLAATAASLRDRNRWQRFPDPARHKLAVDLWFEQSAWWDAEHTPLERDLRMKTLVLASLSARAVDGAVGGAAGTPVRGGREAAIAELERLYRTPEVVEPSDFADLLGLLRQEPALSQSAERIFTLALHHVSADQPSAENAATLNKTLIERFGESSRPLLERVLAAAGPEGARAAAVSTDPLLRAAAAPELATLAEDRDVGLLMQMLKDPDEHVEIAAIKALGEHKVESARVELLLRARLRSSLAIRAAALEAVGAMGGDSVLDALVLGLADPAHEIKLASARGLAALGDPAAAPLLISLLGQGRDSEVFEPARAGLIALGERAWPDLLRAINTPGNRARREAAVILSLQSVPQAAPILISILTDQAGDAFVAAELAVLTCVDLRQEGNPAGAWWDWWEGVVHDDSLAWLRGALEREGVTAPATKDLAGAGSRTGALFLLDVLARKESHLVERARRELGRLLGRDLGTLPPTGTARSVWILGLRAEIDRHWQ